MGWVGQASAHLGREGGSETVMAGRPAGWGDKWAVMCVAQERRNPARLLLRIHTCATESEGAGPSRSWRGPSFSVSATPECMLPGPPA